MKVFVYFRAKKYSRLKWTNLEPRLVQAGTMLWLLDERRTGLAAQYSRVSHAIERDVKSLHAIERDCVVATRTTSMDLDCFL